MHVILPLTKGQLSCNDIIIWQKGYPYSAYYHDYCTTKSDSTSTSSIQLPWLLLSCNVHKYGKCLTIHIYSHIQKGAVMYLKNCQPTNQVVLIVIYRY